MREILYLQFGSYSNYIGAHFWNTQDAYLSSLSGDEGPVEDQISFTERQNPDGITFYPRVMMFDWKDNFGTLAQSNAITGATDDPALGHGLWDRPVEEIRQNQVPKSSYHLQLEEKDQIDFQPANLKEIRYWSDYSHVYCLPRSVHRVNRPMSGEAEADSWGQSQDQFRQYNEASDTDLMDSSVRLFLEESDSIQGVHLMADVSAFGGFSNALMGQLEDEYLKMPVVAFPILDRAHVDVSDAQRIRRLFNEALYLRNLRERTSLSIPISMPQAWSEKAWTGSPISKSPYFSSSIVAAHVETVTFPLRTRKPQDSIGAYGSHLVAGGSYPSFAEISGVIPVNSGTNFGHNLANFTIPSSEQTEGRPFSVRDVIRGFSPPERQNYETWRESTIHNSMVETMSFAGYPLTEPLHTTMSSDAGDVHVLSRLSTSNGLARMFKDYASLIDASLRHRSAGIMSMGIDADDIVELVSDLWTIHDSYPPESRGYESEDIVGSDEE